MLDLCHLSLIPYFLMVSPISFCLTTNEVGILNDDLGSILFCFRIGLTTYIWFGHYFFIISYLNRTNLLGMQH